nr:hypothetical protein [uncultured Acetatifactor sp.]
MKENLRPCTIKIEEETITTRTIHGERRTKVVKEAETHKGYFHTWAHESYVTNGFMVGTTAGQVSTLYGVVEYEDGTIHKVAPECIAFTDNHVISVNIDYDMIANAVTKMMKD